MKILFILSLAFIAFATMEDNPPTQACVDDWLAISDEIQACNNAFAVTNDNCLVEAEQLSNECKEGLEDLKTCCKGIGTVCVTSTSFILYDVAADLQYAYCFPPVCADQQNKEDEKFIESWVDDKLCDTDVRPLWKSCDTSVDCGLDLGDYLSIAISAVIVVILITAITCYCKKKSGPAPKAVISSRPAAQSAIKEKDEWDKVKVDSNPQQGAAEEGKIEVP